MGWAVVASLFVDNTALLAENEKGLQRAAHEFYNSCSKWKLKVKVRKSTVMATEKEVKV